MHASRTGMLTEAELRDLVRQRRDRHRADGLSRPLRAPGRQALRRPISSATRCSAHGMHACDYLLACDMEMDPVPGLPLHLVGEGLRRRALRARPRPRCAAPPGSSARRWCCATSTTSRATRSSTSRRAPSSSASSSAPPPPATCRWAPPSSSSSSCARPTSRRTQKGFDRLETAGWFIEDYHTLQGFKVEPLVGAIRRHARQPRACRSSRRRASGARASTRSTCATPTSSRWPTATSSTSRRPRRSRSSRAWP